ncbi:MAG: transcriptional repressor [Streptosporangiales bacterium]|nr:transcriptional repressor [Streptosporangiales bacterium]
MDDATRLRTAGLRVTAARLAILEVIRTGDHLDVDAITRQVRARTGRVTMQAVYDAVSAMTRAGIIRRIEPAGHPARYEARVGDDHHHVVCRGCGAVADVDRVAGHALCLRPASDTGFLVDEAEVTFWGICPRCASRDS